MEVQEACEERLPPSGAWVLPENHPVSGCPIWDVNSKKYTACQSSCFSLSLISQCKMPNLDRQLVKCPTMSTDLTLSTSYAEIPHVDKLTLSSSSFNSEKIGKGFVCDCTCFWLFARALTFWRLFQKFRSCGQGVGCQGSKGNRQEKEGRRQCTASQTVTSTVEPWTPSSPMAKTLFHSGLSVCGTIIVSAFTRPTVILAYCCCVPTQWPTHVSHQSSHTR